MLSYLFFILLGTTCPDLTLNCGPTLAENFMPSNGKLVATFDSNIGNKILFVSFYWDSEENMSALQSNPEALSFRTLEPDVIFPAGDNAAYIGEIVPQEALNQPTITAYRKIPCAYFDTGIDDFDSFKPTVGSACAEEFDSGQIYYSLLHGKNGSSQSDIGLRFQLGSFLPDSSCIYTVSPGQSVPLYLLAPYCIFSCCHDEGGTNENNIFVVDNAQAPGCFDWSWQNGFSNCIEICDNQQDNDWDGLVDCEDPDCSESSACNCISGDPCCSVVSGNGYYCGSDDELDNYSGNSNNLLFCVNGVTMTVESCLNGCEENVPEDDAYCILDGCTPICNPGNSQCNGNNVEICSDDQCSFVYDHSCGTNETCINGVCIANGAPAPIINSVSCTTYERGDIATCTIYGSNFVAGGGTYIEDMENRQILSLSSNQVVVRGLWHCMNLLGYKQVSHLNPDGQRDDTYSMVETVMGELQITGTWPEYVHEGDSNFTVGANGCNLGATPVLYVEGVQVDNVFMQSEGEVNGTGTVVAESDGTSGDICVAQYSGAPIGFAKKCCYDCITILP